MSNATPNTPALDLDAIEQEIINVETALERLAAGTYFVDEITGSALADDVLAYSPGDLLGHAGKRGALAARNQ